MTDLLQNKNSDNKPTNKNKKINKPKTIYKNKKPDIYLNESKWPQLTHQLGENCAEPAVEPFG
jgi:hypothetical protein